LIFLWAFLLGVVVGLRSMTGPAAVAWGLHLGWFSVEGTWLAFMGFRYTAVVLTAMAIAELIGDKLPTTPSRKSPIGFGGRIVSGALVGATVGAAGGGGSLAMILGAVAGIVGAVVGTLGGAAVRGKLAAAFGRDMPAALIEDCMAIGLAVAMVVMIARVR
jgi:uncharacterized membrane protein